MRKNPKLTTDNNIDDVVISGIYPYYIEGGLPTNFPHKNFLRGNLIVFNSIYHTTQLIIDNNGIVVFRTKINAWENWYSFDTKQLILPSNLR